MQSSRYLETKIRQAEKKAREDVSFNLDKAVLEAFTTVLSGPKALSAELYERFGLSHEKLFLIVDLFNDELALEEGSAFSDDETAGLIELINRYDGELELSQLTALMQYFLDLGAI